MTGVTQQDLHDLRDELVRRMTAGFDGINRRLDTQNGRIGKTVADVAQHTEALNTLKQDRRDLWANLKELRITTTRPIGTRITSDEAGEAIGVMREPLDGSLMRMIFGLVALATVLANLLWIVVDKLIRLI